MFVIDDHVYWSASDLAAAARCEYGLVRTLDYKLHRADKPAIVDDPLETHIAGLGDAYEQELLDERRVSGSIIELPHLKPPFTQASLDASAQTSLAAFADHPQVVYQPAFFDGEFFGYADFVEDTADGWIVCDAKLARHAKPEALLQLAAYADQIDSLGLRLAPTVSLLLGNGARQDFPLREITPVFRERRARLRHLITEHVARDRAVAWGEPGIEACGRCPECQLAAESEEDLLVVAGMRMSQRKQLNDNGIISLADLANADDSDKPERMPTGTFSNLRLQARLQWQQQKNGGDGPLWVPTVEAVEVLAQLPAPSPGDLFFDFEGDPLYYEFDRSRVGLEYLWGVMDATGEFTPTWAHTWAEERSAFIAFVDNVTARREEFPDMHVYHYAPYETTALKRLAMRYQVREDALDELLRGQVFVDLYATVRGAIRVATPSYSIKKLEPLYMGDELRASDDEAVAEGAGSVVAYHEYRQWWDTDPQRAQARLESLADYNRYDCLSTMRLRDWLLDRARELNVVSVVGHHVDSSEPASPSNHVESEAIYEALMAKAIPDPGTPRSPTQQAYSMLATAMGFFRRENKQFWWQHFDRLHSLDSDQWNVRDVFIVEHSEVIDDWAHLADSRSKKLYRELRLVGQWTPGSKPSKHAHVVYARRHDARPGLEFPPGTNGPEMARCWSAEAVAVEGDQHTEGVVRLIEARNPGEEFVDVPIALSPAKPPFAGVIEQAIAELAGKAAYSESEPVSAVWDLLKRQAPRFRDGGPVPQPATPADTADTVVAALRAMDWSYLAIQGPPGTGKTYTGARVIKQLVEKGNWRIGVVAQSHAAVENLLDEVVKAGLDPAHVGKSKPTQPNPRWTEVKDSSKARAKFLDDHTQTGCVLGGTTWTFSATNSVGRSQLDLLVVDEAGQFSLAHTLGAAASAQRLLLLGDPQQLPQVTLGTHAEPVDESALGWLLDGHATMPAEFGYFLGQSYRMHPALCQRVSNLSYDNRLTATTAAAGRSLDGVTPGLRVVTVDHEGNSTESAQEAATVVQLILDALGRQWRATADDPGRPLSQGDFIVVAPYNAQVHTIRAALDTEGLTDVQVGTVDNFQGRQAPFAIVSMTASSHEEVPRGMGFLLNRNRINVAVSRAQWCAVIVRSAALSAYMPASAEDVLELGAFLALADAP